MGKESDKLGKALKQWKIDYGKETSKFKKNFVCVAERKHWHRLYNILYPALKKTSDTLPWRYTAPKFEQVLAAVSHMEMLEAVFPKPHKKRQKLDGRKYTKTERDSLEQRFGGVKKPLAILGQLMMVGAGGDKAFKYPSASFTAFLFQCLESIAVGLQQTKKLKGDPQTVASIVADFISSSKEARPLLDQFYEKAWHTSCERKGNELEYVL